MKRKIATSLIALGCALAAYSATPSKYSLKINDFSELKVIDGINVDYRCNPDSAGIAVYNTTKELASMIVFDPHKTKLEIRVNAPEGTKPTDLPTVTVYSTYLSKVENSGDSLVRVYNPQSGPKFSAKLIGNGRLAVHGVNTTQASASIMTGKGQLVISGKCERASLSLTGGSGSIQADRLKAVDASCKLLGTGTIGCYASEKLSIFGTGTGKVYYTGSPKEISTKSVGISAINIDAK